MSTNNSYVIKIGDILHNLGSKDTISFSNKFSTFLPQLGNEGLSFKVQLQSLSDEQLLVSIPKVVMPLSLECDYCGKGFEEIYYSKRLTTKAVKSSLLDKDKGFEISIDEKNSIINIEDWLVQSLLVTFPVSNMCKTCEEKPSEEKELTHDENNIIRKKV